MAGLLAQGCTTLTAAQLGVFLHGVAADQAATHLGVRAMIPSDLLDHLGASFLFLEKQRS
jgi:NAD(P)H-hydrate epimerase